MLDIIIPSYNNKWGLRDALRSLENQTKKMFLVTVVDDNSSEDLLPIINQFKDSLKISYIKNTENLGPGGARNIGIEDAIRKNCSLIMFMDSDDLLQPRAVEVLSHKINFTGDDFVGSPILSERKHGEATVLNHEGNLTWLHGKIYRTQFLQKYNIRFSDKLRYNEDCYFNLICAYLTNKKSVIDEICYIWRDNRESVTRKPENNFSVENNAGYIKSQILAINFILEKNDIPSLLPNLTLTLYNIFRAYQFEVFLEHDLTDINKEMEKLLNNDKFIELFNKETIFNLFSRLEAVWYYPNQKKAAFPKNNFMEWISLFNDNKLLAKMEEFVIWQK